MAYNKSLKYLILEVTSESDFKNKKLIVAKDLLNSFVDECKIEKFQIISEFLGNDFEGTICSHPFHNLGYDYNVPMLEARFVTTEQGTGIVHCAPSHGPDDFNLCLSLIHI